MTALTLSIWVNIKSWFAPKPLKARDPLVHISERGDIYLRGNRVGYVSHAVGANGHFFMDGMPWQVMQRLLQNAESSQICEDFEMSCMAQTGWSCNPDISASDRDVIGRMVDKFGLQFA